MWWSVDRGAEWEGWHVMVRRLWRLVGGLPCYQLRAMPASPALFFSWDNRLPWTCTSRDTFTQGLCGLTVAELVLLPWRTAYIGPLPSQLPNQATIVAVAEQLLKEKLYPYIEGLELLINLTCET